MKKVIIVVIVIAALLLGLPPVFGILAQRKVDERLAAFESNPCVSNYLAANVKSFERGWFSSHALIDIGLSDEYLAMIGAMVGAQAGVQLPTDMLRQRATIAVDFAHGPIAVLNGVHFGLAKMVARLDPSTPGIAMVQQTLGIPYVFEYRGRTGFGGGVSFDADIPPFQIAPAGVNFSGAFLDGTLSGKRLVSSMHVDSINVASPIGTFEMGNLRGKVNNDYSAARCISPGSTDFDIEHITFGDPTQGATPMFDAKNLHFSGNVTLDDSGSLFSMEATYGVESVLARDTRIADASIGLALHKIDIALLEAYLSAPQQTAFATDPGQALAGLRPQIERALTAGPSLAFDPIRFRLDDEPFEASIELTTDPTKLPAPGSFSFQDPSVWMAFASAGAKLNVSKPLAQRLAVLATQMQFAQNPNLDPEQAANMAQAQAGLMLVTLVGQGILSDAGDAYKTDVRFADRALTVNGTPLPLGGLP